MLLATDNTVYTNASTLVADAVNNLTYAPVTVSDPGGSIGVVQVYSNGAYYRDCPGLPAVDRVTLIHVTTGPEQEMAPR